MRYSQFLVVLSFSTTVFTMEPRAEGTPDDVETIATRDVFTRCTPGGEGICTLYMATGIPGFVTIHPYRNFALFDNACQLTSFFATEKDVKHVKIKGHLPEAVEIEVNQDTRPRGTISYKDRSWDLGEELECHGSDDMDGVGCRRHFIC
ncbi:hypothetical protein ACHAQH_009187 [Verticillium albo-atrum]